MYIYLESCITEYWFTSIYKLNNYKIHFMILWLHRRHAIKGNSHCLIGLWTEDWAGLSLSMAIDSRWDFTVLPRSYMVHQGVILSQITLKLDGLSFKTELRITILAFFARTKSSKNRKLLWFQTGSFQLSYEYSVMRHSRYIEL